MRDKLSIVLIKPMIQFLSQIYHVLDNIIFFASVSPNKNCKVAHKHPTYDGWKIINSFNY